MTNKLLILFVVAVLIWGFSTTAESREQETQALKAENETLKAINADLREQRKELLELTNRLSMERDAARAELEKARAEIATMQEIPVVVTGYAPFDNVSGICADDNPGNTSTGRTPGPAYAASDPDRLPYGTMLEIPGYGVVEIQDTGGALRSDPHNVRIDVYFDSHADAIAWGRQNTTARIIYQ